MDLRGVQRASLRVFSERAIFYLLHEGGAKIGEDYETITCLAIEIDSSNHKLSLIARARTPRKGIFSASRPRALAGNGVARYRSRRNYTRRARGLTRESRFSLHFFESLSFYSLTVVFFSTLLLLLLLLLLLSSC